MKKILIILGASIVLFGGSYLVWKKFEITKIPAERVPTESVDEVLEFKDESKFGFLAEPDDTKTITAIKEIGAGWLRPHPGRFIWNEMQESPTGDIDFNMTDEEIKKAQASDFNLLITLWPFAEWDQKSRPDAAKCKVSSSEQFARILTIYRCNPNDWDAYKKWLSAVAERYDGDGQDDMPGLKMPVRYWEVLNEPDMAEITLTFFKDSPEDYTALLKNTYKTIKQADSNAQILIAGAAGGGRFLDFWEKVFAISEVKDFFDIANIHCLADSNDLNVSEYKKILEKFGISKPIWVTEAQNTRGDLAKSVEGAFKSGAEKIFFTGAAKETTGPPEPFSITKNKNFFKSIIEKY